MPKLTKDMDARINVEMPSRMKGEIQAAARDEGISANEFARRALNERLAKLQHRRPFISP